MLLVLFLPAILLLIAVTIIDDSAGFPLFRQRRLGLGGKLFLIVKIRTFSPGIDQKTPWQAFMRRHKLDELPQLWNVVKGEMSLVGPRPKTRSEREKVLSQRADWNRRLDVRPGLTGLAQLQRAERSWNKKVPSWQDELDADIEYVDSWSAINDLEILARTIEVVIRGVGTGRD